MTHQAFLVHRHVSRSGPRQTRGDAHPTSLPGAVGARRETVKVANLISSHYGFAISGKPPRLEHDLPAGTGSYLLTSGHIFWNTISSRDGDLSRDGPPRHRLFPSVELARPA
jgi:hypothetical protein